MYTLDWPWLLQTHWLSAFFIMFGRYLVDHTTELFPDSVYTSSSDHWSLASSVDIDWEWPLITSLICWYWLRMTTDHWPHLLILTDYDVFSTHCSQIWTVLLKTSYPARWYYVSHLMEYPIRLSLMMWSDC